MNKGFTLIEVLVSILIIGLILVITIPSYMYVYQSVKTTNYNNKVNVIKQRAVDYGETIKDEIQSDNCRTILISDLIKKGYINSDYNNKNALTNPLDNQEFRDDLNLCYCKSDNTLKAFIVDPFDYQIDYFKGAQVSYNGKIYECMSTYDYNLIINDIDARKVTSLNGTTTTCTGYYNSETNLCITNKSVINANYVISNFFKMVEC